MTIDQRMDRVLEFYAPGVRPAPREAAVFPGRFNGRVAAVTGAASGIGAAVARRLVREGAVVVICDRNAELARAVGDELASAGGAVSVIATDLSDTRQSPDVVNEIVARHGKLDILVNSAGISHNVSWDQLVESDWDRVFAINLKGLFFLSQAAAKQMVAQGRGGLSAWRRSRANGPGATSTTRPAKPA